MSELKRLILSNDIANKGLLYCHSYKKIIHNFNLIEYCILSV